MEQYDVIVIGARNGGLAAAATLAEKGKSVILFERHNIPGGCGSSFRRGRFEFEIALHQLSHMGTPDNPGPLREQFARYGILDEIEWIEIKELFRVNFPDGTGVSLPADREKCVAHLCKEFPAEAESIKEYFKVVYDFCEESTAFAAKSAQSTGEPGALKKLIMKTGFPHIYPTLAKYALKSTQEVLDEFFKDPKLQLALSAYWCFMGMPPERFPFAILAKCTYFYTETKPHYLRGTSMMMNQAIMEAIGRMGGVVRLNCGVKRIVLENGEAVGVVDENGVEYRAKKIISNISPLATYGALLSPEEVPESAREYLKPYTVGISALALLVSCTFAEFFIKRGIWLQHRAQTLALFGMFSLAVDYQALPMFSITATYNPTAWTVLSALALIVNAAVFVYEVCIIVKTKRNPLKQEMYTHLPAYRKNLEANGLRAE